MARDHTDAAVYAEMERQAGAGVVDLHALVKATSASLKLQATVKNRVPQVAGPRPGYHDGQHGEGCSCA